MLGTGVWGAQVAYRIGYSGFDVSAPIAGPVNMPLLDVVGRAQTPTRPG